MFLVLSKVSDTSARLAGLRLFEPLKITLSIFSDRSIRVLCSPNTQRIESTTFDLPQPLGPTMAVTPSLKLMVILSPKLLKPLISNCVSCIYTLRLSGCSNLQINHKKLNSYPHFLATYSIFLKHLACLRHY